MNLSNTKTFYCVCGMGFYFKTLRDAHARHHVAKNICQHCRKTFAIASGLRQHQVEYCRKISYHEKRKLLVEDARSSYKSRSRSTSAEIDSTICSNIVTNRNIQLDIFDKIEEMNECIESTVERLTNSKLDHSQWILLPQIFGCRGLGVRRVPSSAFHAFLPLVNALSSMIGFMLHLLALYIVEIFAYHDGISAWQHLDPETNGPELPELQKQWYSIRVIRFLEEHQFDQKLESRAWLYRHPTYSSSTLGKLLDNNVLRIMVGLRLSSDICHICALHMCVCGSLVNTKGRHNLKCNKSTGRWSRHAERYHQKITYYHPP